MNTARFSPRQLIALFRNNVNARLIVIVLALTLIPVLIIGIIATNTLRGSLLNSQRETLGIEQRLAAEKIEEVLRERVDLFEVLAKNDAILRYLAAPPSPERDALGKVAEGQLRTVVTQNGEFESVGLLDASGKLVVEALSLKGGNANLNSDQTTRDYYQQVKATGKTYISPIQLSAANKAPALFFATPVNDPASGKPLGMLRVRLDNSTIQRIIGATNTAMGSGAGANAVSILVVDQTGLIIEDSSGQAKVTVDKDANLFYRSVGTLTKDQEDALKKSRRFGTDKVQIAPLNTSPEFTAAFQRNAEVQAFRYTLDGTGYYAAVSPLARTGWRVIALTPESVLSATVNRQTQTLILIGLIVGLIGALLAFVLARQIIRPVDRMTAVARRIADGDYTGRMPAVGEDQFANLGRTVNTMIEQISSTGQQQEAQNAAMQTQIVRLLEEVSSVAEGDLTVEAEVSGGALGAVADSFNYMIAELRQIVGRVNGATQQVGRSTDEILATTDVLNRAAQQQAARIADTSTAVEEMAVSIQQVSENAAVSARVAREARATAADGAGAVAATVAGMGRIRDRVQETARTIEQLGASSQEIGAIVSLIREVADQTELLALNAAIEAALVGEQGRGFAVVAEEVRRLAERVTVASAQIDTLVQGVQGEAIAAMAAMAEGTREVVAGAELADEAGRALARLDATAIQLADLIESISAAADQQARASVGIARSMTEVSSLTTDTTAGTQQAAASVAALATLADDLRESVAAFRLGDERVPVAQTSTHHNNRQAQANGTGYATATQRIDRYLSLERSAPIAIAAAPSAARQESHSVATLEEVSLYQRLGGMESIEAVVEDFYRRVLADDTLTLMFAGIDLAQLRKHQAVFLSHALGGPNRYTGKRMEHAHEGLNITPTQFGAVAGHLSSALASFDVPQPLIDEVIGHVAKLQGSIVGR